MSQDVLDWTYLFIYKKKFLHVVIVTQVANKGRKLIVVCEKKYPGKCEINWKDVVHLKKISTNKTRENWKDISWNNHFIKQCISTCVKNVKIDNYINFPRKCFVFCFFSSSGVKTVQFLTADDSVCCFFFLGGGSFPNPHKVNVKKKTLIKLQLQNILLSRHFS